MPEDIRGPISVTPALFRVEEPKERLPGGRQPAKTPSKLKKSKKRETAGKSSANKGCFIDVRV